MPTDTPQDISFALPKAGKLKAARELGLRFGAAWFAVSPDAPSQVLPEPVRAWSSSCRVAWREGMSLGWHAAQAETKGVATDSGSGMLVGYARVSTKEQEAHLQLDALRVVGCGKIFTEKASGAQRDRPELLAALDYTRSGDTLVVWKLDRLARSLKQLIETVDGLESRGIGLRSLTEAIDTTTAGGKLVFQIFGALAEFERSIIRERTRAGLDAARVRGRVGGRPPALSDRDLAMAKTLLGNPEITVEQVAKRLGVGASTLYRHLPGGRSGLESDVLP